VPNPPYLLAALAACVIVTWGLRALPFAALTPLRTSAVIDYLSTRMPVGVMVILAVYTLRDFSLADQPRALATALALAATLGLHLWRRNAALSILGGTAVHVTLASALLSLSSLLSH
jgi:branched-subunit amino acid transport protein AzlD